MVAIVLVVAKEIKIRASAYELSYVRVNLRS